MIELIYSKWYEPHFYMSVKRPLMDFETFILTYE